MSWKTFHAFVPLVALLFNLALLILVLEKRRARGNAVFAQFLLCMVVWNFGTFMLRTSSNSQAAIQWVRFSFFGTLFFPCFLLHFVLIFLGTPNRKWIYVSYITCSLSAAIAITTKLVVAGISTNIWGWVTQPGPLFAPLYFILFVFLGYGAYCLIKEHRKIRDELQRNRVSYILLGFSIFFLGASLDALPLFGVQIYPAGMIANIFFVLCITYAVVRYRLLDITVVIRKGLLYSIPTAIIGAGYFLAVSLAVNLFHVVTGYHVLLLSLAMAAVTAVAAQPLRERAQAWVDRLFFREKYDAYLMLQELSREVASIIQLEELLNMILKELVARMHIARIGIFLREGKAGDFRLAAQRGLDEHLAHLSLRKDHPVVSWLAQEGDVLAKHQIVVFPHFKALWRREREELEGLGAELLISLRAKGELVGILAVGPRLSEELYSQDDQLTLTTLANQTAVAIQNARLYWDLKRTLSELREAHDELERRVEERTAELAEANEALQAEIAERKRVEEQIKASLGEKEVLLKEIHHRVKNNLQVVSSMLQLQSKNVKDRETVEMFQESRNRVRSMALVHERLYQSRDLARVDFARYIRSLANYLCRSYGVNTNVIQLRTNLHDVFLGVDTAIPCGLILNELVSNCLKHAFPDGREGEIRIELRSDGNDKFTLMVSDNGVGLLEDLDFRNTESLGLQLVNTLVNQLEGTIELDRRGGTAFKITFGEIKYKERQ
jgi:two-component sensor histidine kinase